MSELVAVALISGGFSAFAATIGVYATYKTSKGSRETAIEVAKTSSATAIRTAEKQADIELEKLRAEHDRLRAEHREAERQNRQGTYHRFLALLDTFDMFATGYPPTREKFDEAVLELNTLHGGILLFGDEEVKVAVKGLFQIWAELEFDANDVVGAFERSYRRRRLELIQEQGKVTAAMAADVGRGIHDN